MGLAAQAKQQDRTKSECGFCRGQPVGNGVRTPFEWERRRENEEQHGPIG